MREKYLSVSEVAELLGTTERFPRRLIARAPHQVREGRRHVRIPESVLSAFIEANTVEPIRPRRRVRRAA
ncbi:excisionase family DNA binding protein [Streptomyces sp. V4I23]|nr:helix-turn-helix domain-containing protein [Streptomyces sp. V4I23]MDQ1009503.1 excisionase family DNA binding protein [Streptomyces sp. V4I23]